LITTSCARLYTAYEVRQSPDCNYWQRRRVIFLTIFGRARSNGPAKSKLGGFLEARI
jgi:hypothetical protein